MLAGILAFDGVDASLELTLGDAITADSHSEVRYSHRASDEHDTISHTLCRSNFQIPVRMAPAMPPSPKAPGDDSTLVDLVFCISCPPCTHQTLNQLSVTDTTNHNKAYPLSSSKDHVAPSVMSSCSNVCNKTSIRFQRYGRNHSRFMCFKGWVRLHQWHVPPELLNSWRCHYNQMDHALVPWTRICLH